MSSNCDEDVEKAAPKRSSTKSDTGSEQKATRAEVEQYTFFNRKLKYEINENGDVYKATKCIKKWWNIDKSIDPKERPYLDHIKRLSTSWRSLELLADFMEVGTAPDRWKKLNSPENKKVRDKRISRTKVTRLDYLQSGTTSKRDYKEISTITESIKEEATEGTIFQLYVIEDLSRDIIELFGSTFDIEPHFFREHIFDQAWYNTRDKPAYPPRFKKLVREQRWFQVRYSTSRYFESSSEFKKATEQAEGFNVSRRPDDDTNNRAIWDDKDAMVSITRTRTSFWLNDAVSGKPRVGILLVDPTLEHGYPLWHGYGNWEKTPSMADATDTPLAQPTRKSFYEDIIYWSQRPESLGIKNPTIGDMPQIPVLAMLHLVASEWLIMAEYIKTRLGQIEWEVSYPEHFLKKENTIDVPLKKLHTWRRLVPLYREMLTETVQGVFRFPPHLMGLSRPISVKNACAECHRHEHYHLTHPMDAMQEEFSRALSYMNEYQTRIDRLTSVVTAIISIGDSRHSQEDNRNVARLTWLATFFIPLSFVSGLFSMTEDVHALGTTYKYFAVVGLLLSVISLGLGIVLTLPQVHTFRRQQVKKLKESVSKVFPKSKED